MKSSCFEILGCFTQRPSRFRLIPPKFLKLKSLKCNFKDSVNALWKTFLVQKEILTPFQTSNFLCGEPNVNELKSSFKFIYIWFGKRRVRRLKRAFQAIRNAFCKVRNLAKKWSHGLSKQGKLWRWRRQWKGGLNQCREKLSILNFVIRKKLTANHLKSKMYNITTIVNEKKFDKKPKDESYEILVSCNWA